MNSWDDLTDRDVRNLQDRLERAENELELLRNHLRNIPNSHKIIREQLLGELKEHATYDPLTRRWFLTDLTLAKLRYY